MSFGTAEGDGAASAAATAASREVQLRRQLSLQPLSVQGGETQVQLRRRSAADSDRACAVAPPEMHVCVAAADSDRACAEAHVCIGADSDRACAQVQTEVHVCVAADGDCPGAEACRRTAEGRLVAAVLPQQAQRLGRVAVERCRGVHLGHVTYLLGPVNVTRVLQRNNISQQIIVTADDAPGAQEGEPEVQIVPRLEWLAQPPLHGLPPLQTPVSIVVISHTATDSSTSMGKNLMIVRRLQMFHIEGRMWPDIGYNFLVGMDGQVYEGRGWACAPEVVGGGLALGCLSLAFVGSFSSRLPSAGALAALHRLLRMGERRGHLAGDYRLLAENQLDPDTESPGRELAGLMRGWPRWAPHL